MTENSNFSGLEKSEDRAAGGHSCQSGEESQKREPEKSSFMFCANFPQISGGDLNCTSTGLTQNSLLIRLKCRNWNLSCCYCKPDSLQFESNQGNYQQKHRHSSKKCNRLQSGHDTTVTIFRLQHKLAWWTQRWPQRWNSQTRTSKQLLQQYSIRLRKIYS